MPQQIRVSRELDATGATVLGIGNAYMGGGNVYYVYEGAAIPSSDGFEGTNPRYPLTTIQAGIDLCRQRRHDYVIVLDSYDDDTFPIEMNKRNIHVIGFGYGPFMEGRGVLDGAGEACFETLTTGGGSEIAGFHMGSTGAADACINAEGLIWQMWIHHNTFASTILAQDGIGDSLDGASGTKYPAYWTIEDNYFDVQLGRNGIRAYALTRCFIRRNVFRGCAGACIYEHAGSATGPVILDNFFHSDSTAEGSAITLGGFCADGLISGNHAAEDGDEPGNNPYLDNSHNTPASMTNAWGVNWGGITAIEPT